MADVELTGRCTLERMETDMVDPAVDVVVDSTADPRPAVVVIT